MPTRTDTMNCVWTNSLWQEQQWLLWNNFLYVRSQLLPSVWQVQEYQQGLTDAFYPALTFELTIDNAFVDGVSITYGNSPQKNKKKTKKNIWVYASRLYLNGVGACVCPSLVPGLIFRVRNATNLIPRFLLSLVMTTIVKLVMTLNQLSLLTFSTLMTHCRSFTSTVLEQISFYCILNKYLL